jgi:hypothetical protein
MKRGLGVGAVVAGAVGIAAGVVWAQAPAEWSVQVQMAVAAPPSLVMDLVESAVAVKDWLGWEQDLDPALTWECAADIECRWTGSSLGSGTLRVLPGDSGWYVGAIPDEGVAWHGQIIVSSAGSGPAAVVRWENRGDWGPVPFARLLATRATASVRARMVRSLSRLARAAESDLARRLKDEAAAARLAAEDAANAAEIERMNAGVREGEPSGD